MKIKQQQVSELESQATHLREVDPEKEAVISSKKAQVEERFRKVLAPLQWRRAQLEKVKKIQQFLRDMEDEKLWVSEKLPQASATDYGNSLLSVQMLQKKNQSLRNDIDTHEPRINSVCDTGREMIADEHPQSDEFQQNIDELMDFWNQLIKTTEKRKERLELSEVSQQVSTAKYNNFPFLAVIYKRAFFLHHFIH